MSKRALRDKKLASRLVESIGSKNYSRANKYLMRLVELKIKDRISDKLNQPLF